MNTENDPKMMEDYESGNTFEEPSDNKNNDEPIIEGKILCDTHNNVN